MRLELPTSRWGVARQIAFAQERGWRDLDFVQTIGDDYAKDVGVLKSDGSEWAAITVFKRDGDKVRLFWAAEMADPGETRARRPTSPRCGRSWI